MKEILSFGAGVQSTTLLLMSCLDVLPKLDHVVFADTQWEPSAVYRHLAKRASYLAHNLPDKEGTRIAGALGAYESALTLSQGPDPSRRNHWAGKLVDAEITLRAAIAGYADWQPEKIPTAGEYRPRKKAKAAKDGDHEGEPVAT